MIITNNIRAFAGGLPGLPAGEATPSRQTNTGGRIRYRPTVLHPFDSVTIDLGRRQTGPPVSTDSTGEGRQRLRRRRPPPVESVVDQIYVAKPYAN